MAPDCSQLNFENDGRSYRDQPRGSDDWADGASLHDYGKIEICGDDQGVGVGSTDALEWFYVDSSRKAIPEVEKFKWNSCWSENSHLASSPTPGINPVEAGFFDLQQDILRSGVVSPTGATRYPFGYIVSSDSSPQGDPTNHLFSYRNITTGHQLETIPSKRLLHSSRQLTSRARARDRVSHCQSCERSFTLLKDLRRHDRSVHARERFSCHVSGCQGSRYGYSRRDKLLRHLRTQHSDRPAQSPRDGIVAFPQPADPVHKSRGQTLSTTCKYLHEHSIAGPCSKGDTDSCHAPADQKMTFTCPLPTCSRVFSNSHDLKRHVQTTRIHSTQDMIDGYRCAALGCTKAGKTWTRLDNFRKHLKQQHKATEVDMRKLIRESTVTQQDYPASPLFAPIATPNSYAKTTTTKTPNDIRSE